ncbi:MAG: arsenite methyltransferase [Pseudomonadota bacterium]
MSEKDDARKQVSEFYTRSVTAGTGCCDGPTLPKGIAARQAGYSEDDLGVVPEDAADSSFGCGNPLAFAGVEVGQTVLDLGCGAGLDLLIASKKVGPGGRVIGVDMTDEMIARARVNMAAAGADNVEIRKGIIEALPVEDGSVDWVISNCVINLSPEKDKVFAEIARVLRPGGHLSVSDIVARDLPDWARHDVDLIGSCVGGAIPEEDYAAGLRAAGLEDVEVVERMIYDQAQIAAFIGAVLADGEVPAGACCGCGPKDRLLRGPAAVAALEGKVWSAKFQARMPL